MGVFSFVLILVFFAQNSYSKSQVLELYGLFSPQTPEATASGQLSKSLAHLSSALGVPVVLPEGSNNGVIIVPAPSSIDLSSDDRIGVPARAALLSRSRRSHADLGGPEAVALSLGHVAAWQRFQKSGAPLGLFVLDSWAVLGDVNVDAREELGRVMSSEGQAWDLLLLSTLVAPLQAKGTTPASNIPESTTLLSPNWMAAPIKWRGWNAYALTAKGVGILLEEGALPLSQRLEGHASSLVDLGLLKAVSWRGGNRAVSPSFFKRDPVDWGLAERHGGPADSLGALISEVPCDLCDIPEDYSRASHLALGILPAAFFTGTITFLVQRILCKSN